MTIVSPWQFDGLISSGVTTTSSSSVGVGDGLSSCCCVKKYAAKPELALIANNPTMANAAPPSLDISGMYGDFFNNMDHRTSVSVPWTAQRP
jgi:hypothetical protein